MIVRFFDTESTDLEARFGRILVTSWVDLGDENPTTIRGDRQPYRGRRIIDDERLVLGTKKALESADLVVSWNGILHDIPLVNARLARYGHPPIRLTEKNATQHIDLMWYARGQSMKLGGARLEQASEFFKIPSSKTKVDPEVWQMAAAGDRESMDYIVDHCERDVIVLRDLWPHLAPGIKKITFTMAEVWPFVKDIPSRVRR